MSSAMASCVTHQVDCPRDWKPTVGQELSVEKQLVNIWKQFLPGIVILDVRGRDRPKSPFCMWHVEVKYFHSERTGAYNALRNLCDRNKPRNCTIYIVSLSGGNNFSIEYQMSGCGHKKLDFPNTDKTEKQGLSKAKKIKINIVMSNGMVFKLKMKGNRTISELKNKILEKFVDDGIIQNSDHDKKVDDAKCVYEYKENGKPLIFTCCII